MYRQILFYIAKNMGYQLHLISRFYAKTNGKPWNHATVLHSCNLVKNCIETKDKEFTKIYKEINEGFQERFRDAELVRSANLQKTIT
jgi:chromosomal replication initiation ATPase DnaA